jgi:hypothetical protein
MCCMQRCFEILATLGRGGGARWTRIAPEDWVEKIGVRGVLGTLILMALIIAFLLYLLSQSYNRPEDK